MLLTGTEFKGIAGIGADGLNDTYDAIKHGFASVSYTMPQYRTASDNTDIEQLKQKRDKTIRALERLKKLFLYDDDGITEKEYLSSKKELEVELAGIESDIDTAQSDELALKYDDMNFIATASGFLISHSIQSDHVDYRSLAAAVDDKVLKDFVYSVISRIVILNGHVSSIEFKNGLVHEFLYR